MDADTSFSNYLAKIGHADLPWEPAVGALRAAFMAGWDACGNGCTGAAPVAWVAPAPQPGFVLGAGVTRPLPLLAASPAPKSLDEAKAIIIYSAWPIKKARGAAIKAIEKALKKASATELLEAVTAYAAAVKTWRPEDMKFVPMCSTWMNQERWTDDRGTWSRGGIAAVSQFSKVTT